MYDYIRGSIAELSPTQVVIDNHGIGYRLQISLQTYSQLQHESSECKVFVHHVVREDDEQLYGFADPDEREIFTLLIGVSGVGPNTARMVLSSLSSEELRQAILGEDITRIKSVKGIGLKTDTLDTVIGIDSCITEENERLIDALYTYGKYSYLYVFGEGEDK